MPRPMPSQLAFARPPSLLVCVVLLAVWVVTGCGDDAPGGGGDADLRPPVDAGEVGVDVPPPPKKSVGEACAGPADCVEGTSCIGTREGAFVCMNECQTPYAICDDGAVCLPVSTGGTAICYTGGALAAETTCRSNLDCAAGHLCIGAGATFYCLPACDDAADTCGEDAYCSRLETGAGVCRPRLGTTCAIDEDCEGASLTCTRSVGSDYDAYLPSGYCSRIGCVDDAGCPGDNPCRSVPGAEAPLCVLACDSDADCRFNAGYRCADASVCDDWPDPDGCRAFFGDDRLCAVPDP